MTAQLGTVLYAIAIGAAAWLFARLVRQREFEDYPFFTGYLGFIAAKGIAVFVLLAAGRLALYAVVYQSSRPVMFVLTAAIAAEALRHAYASFALERRLQFAAALPAFALILNFSLELQALTQLAIGGVALACAPRMRQMPSRAIGVMLGVFAMEILPAAVTRTAAVAALPVLRWVPTLSFLLALAVWFRYFPNQAKRAATVR